MKVCDICKDTEKLSNVEEIKITFPVWTNPQWDTYENRTIQAHPDCLHEKVPAFKIKRDKKI